MLNDPSVINYTQSVTVAGGTASNFRRTAIGTYTSVDGSFTSVLPARLSLKPQVVLQGPSTYRSRFEMEKAVAPVNGVQQKNDVLKVDIILSGNLRSFVASDFVHALYAVAVFVGSNFTRIISGES